MRLLIIGLNFAPELTGVGKYTGEMAAWLADRGHEVTVVAAPPYYPAWKIAPGHRRWAWRTERWEGCTVVRCPLYVPAKATGARRILHLASFALASLPAALWQLIGRPDIVVSIAPTLLSSPIALTVARLAGAASWLHVQDFEIDAAIGLGLMNRSGAHRAAVAFERFLLKRFDLLSTISPKMRERLAAKGAAPERCHVFPNWVDTQLIHPLSGPNPLREELGFSAERPIVLYSGSMGDKHGLEIVVEAARRLAHEASPAPSPLFVLSGQGPARDGLMTMARGLPNVRFVDLQPSDRLNELLNLADVHLLPQRSDVADLVMPSKLGPMLASGRPVIATVTPESQVAQALAGCGVIVPPGDTAALAAAIRDLMQAPEQRQQMGAAARRYALNKLAASSILERMETQLAALIGQGAVPATVVRRS